MVRKIVIKIAMALMIAILTKGDEIHTHYGANEYKMGDHCKQLSDLYKNKTPRIGNLTMEGKTKHVVVMSSHRAPSRARAAIIAAAIRHKAGYDNVFTRIHNTSVKQLAASISRYHATQAFSDEELLIHVDANWAGAKETGPGVLPGCDSKSLTCSIAGSRLTDLGETPSVNLRLYTVLSKNVINTDDCKDAIYWLFYRNYTALQKCEFLQNGSDNSEYVPLLITPEVANPPKLETENIGVFLKRVDLSDRFELNNQIENAIASFLFIDYDLGHENRSNVRTVLLPDVILPANVQALQVGDYALFEQISPRIVSILNKTNPQPEDLRQILDVNSSVHDIDEAACAWAYENRNKFESWTETSDTVLDFLILLCDNDIDNLNYEKAITKVWGIIENNLKFKFNILRAFVNCSSTEAVSDRLLNLRMEKWYKSIAGVAVPKFGAKGAADAALSKRLGIQVVFYDVPGSTRAEFGLAHTHLHSLATTVSGSKQQLAHSMSLFLKKQGWSRLAIISELSSISESDMKIELLTHKTIKQYKEVELENLNTANIRAHLLNFQKDKAHVFFLNTGPEAACMIICEAASLNMVDDSKYAWIARDWWFGSATTTNCTKDIKDVQVFTVSYWWRGGNDSLIESAGGNKNIRSALNEEFDFNTWPVLAAPLIDALQFMVERVDLTLKEHKNKDDIHGDNFIEILTAKPNKTKRIQGVVQEIEQTNFLRHDPFVFVSAWRGNRSNLIAIWRAQSHNDTIIEEHPIYEPYYGGERPDDGKCKCMMTKSGNDFNPYCHDPIWICFFIILLIAPVAIWKLRAERLAQQERRERHTRMQLLSRCKRTAALLTPHLVDRTALSLYEELGSGHFGRVRFGMLRLRNRPPTPVAAKTLRKNAEPAEEAEFLREASTIATLSHDHVIRLVGVCADVEGPPILLMEHAFFGDLLKYLRQRRHLAEINERDQPVIQGQIKEGTAQASDPEARHVTAKELTRLAREAADALAYLSDRHILHRDVRAANCVVDAKRTLKLVDFGMSRIVRAKSTIPDEPEESEDYKYICRRRGVFPVPWMAPESLEKGEFSRASDVWALGVLMLEIATLGARPYGAWQPLQVLRFVRSGGKPALPRDASYHTCEVIELCWSEIPEERASAKEIHEYLVLHPTCLRAALRPAWPEPDCERSSDSGFGERDADREWGKGADLRISTL